MLKNLFGKGKKNVEQQSAAATPVAPAQPTPQRSQKPTKKKKNTYIVHLNTFTAHGMHAWCDTTPLTVVTLNGKPTDNVGKAFMTATRFPNPGASQMEVLFNNAPEWRIIGGDKMTQTIIEYLDKESGKPVLVLYPTGHVSSLVHGMDANTVVGTRLNHASRRDFVRQYNRIIEYVQLVNPLLNARTQAMQHAPQNSYEKRAEFMNELNRMQMERAKQIIAQRQK
ncbi:MAG: plasminogen receptor (KT) [Lachnospiraceae bacterium]|nr:plasminogen receptor (KT) [Lachnospiraceae bacterium]